MAENHFHYKPVKPVRNVKLSSGETKRLAEQIRQKELYNKNIRVLNKNNHSNTTYYGEDKFAKRKAILGDVGVGVRLFTYIAILFFLATILRGSIVDGTLSSRVPTFQSLLNSLQTLPQGTISMNVVAEITADWGWDAGIFYISFNWLRDFLNLYIYAINAFVWLGSNLIYVFKFIGVVIQWLFIG